MPEAIEKLEQDILAQLLHNTGNETTLEQLMAGLRHAGNQADDVLVRMALWPLIAQQKVELTKGFTLKLGTRG